MELRIRDSQGFVDKGFGEWLIPRIQTKLISSISKYKLVNWDNYLTESPTLERLYNMSYKTEDIIIFASKNIQCTGTDGDITIHFNRTKFTPGFNKLKLDTIVRTINYGTQDNKACPIFTDVLNYFADDIDTYVRQYYML